MGPRVGEEVAAEGEEGSEGSEKEDERRYGGKGEVS